MGHASVDRVHRLQRPSDAHVPNRCDGIAVDDYRLRSLSEYLASPINNTPVFNKS